MGWYFFENNWAVKIIKKKLSSIAELTAYPTFKVMGNKSPAVSPNVVAQIFIIQNATVICGSLLIIFLKDISNIKTAIFNCKLLF